MDFPLAFAPGYTEVVGSLIAITASASTNTKGAYTQLAAATARAYSGLWVCLSNNNLANRALVDIAVGGAGSEQVIASNLYSSHIIFHTNWFYLPVEIPEGVRVAARSQSNTGSGQVNCAVIGVTGSFFTTPPGGILETLGADTGTTTGVTVDPGGTINTYGSWVTVSASTSHDIAGLFLALGTKNNTAPAQASLVVDIGVGGAGSEVAVIAGLNFLSSTAGNYGPLPGFWLPCSIPAGSRVAARAQASTNNATDRLFDLVLYGLVI